MNAQIESATPFAQSDKQKTFANPALFVSPDKRAMAAGIQQMIKQHDTGHKSRLNLSSAISQQGSSLDEKLYQHYFELGQLLLIQQSECQKLRSDSNQHNQPTHIKLNQLDKIIRLSKTIAKISFIPLPPLLAELNDETKSHSFCLQLDNYFLSNFKN